jgi:hypothetical protein
MNYFYFVLFILSFLGCKKKEFPTNPPISSSSKNQDSIINSIKTTSFKGETWILTNYKIGDYGVNIYRNDTLIFLNYNNYLFNNQNSTYNLYPSLGTYTLTMNGTFLGNLSGTIYEYNIKTGSIEGLKFKDISTNTPNNSIYYIWLKRK